MPADPSAKRQALRAAGTFNPRAAQVRHTLFEHSDFFDPEDLLQLKYETLRTLEKDGYSIAKAAREFGLSRPTIYQAQELNDAIAPKLTELNAKPFQKMEGSRDSWFEAHEQAALLPLPPEPFELADWSKAKVNIDYHVSVEMVQRRPLAK